MNKEYYIKNMVCDRCIKVLKTELEAAKLKVMVVELGRVEIETENPRETQETVRKIAQKNGFEFLENPESYLVERTKIELIYLLENLPLERKENLSEILSRTLRLPYSKISKTFSSQTGLTLEKYFIKLKIERVKELVQANQHNFTEIGYLLNYSNVNHLSRQFKTETGMSLSAYKTEKDHNRKPLDGIL